MPIDNPFMNSKIVIKLDELLRSDVSEVLEDSGSSVTVTVSEQTVLRAADQLRAQDASTLQSEEQVRIVLGALGIHIREDSDATQ